MIARHKKPRHDLIDVLHLKSCGAAEKSLRGCKRRAIMEVATPRLQPTVIAIISLSDMKLSRQGARSASLRVMQA